MKKHNVNSLHDSHYDMIEGGMHDALDDLGDRFESYDNELETIEHECRSGFIPFTDGGFIASVWASNSYFIGSGTEPAYISNILHEQEKEFLDDWKKENPNDDFDDDSSLYDDCLSEYLGFTFFDIRLQFYSCDNPRNESGSDEVYISCGYNMDEYGRDSLREVLKSETIKISDLSKEKLASCIGDMIEALK